jgi:hypothetical protein
MIGAMKLKALPLALVLTLVLAVAVLSACGGSDDTSTSVATTPGGLTTTSDPAPYPDKVRDEFTKSCYASSGGKKSLCDCLIKAYEDTLSFDDYQKITVKTKPGVVPPQPPQETQDAANACASEHAQKNG